MLLELGKYNCKTKLFQKRFDKAIEEAKKAFIRFDNICLNFSGGKDSSALFGVVSEAALQLNRSFKVWIHISDASFPGTIEIAKKTCELFDVELLVSECKESAFNNFKLNKAEKQFGKSGVFFDAIKENIETNKFDLVFIGNRKQESKRRLKACISNGYIYSTKVATPHYCSTPIMNFKLEDVASTIVRYNLPLHPIYNKIHDRGWEHIRLGYITAKDLTSLGTIHFIKRNYKDMYTKLVMADPKVRCYV